jgi:hypothetical protein
MVNEPATPVATEIGVSLDFMKFIQNDNLEITGLRFRYNCRGVFADITMSPKDPITCQESRSIIAEYLEKYEKISAFWNDESEPADADVDIVENEIQEFVCNLYYPTLRGLVPPGSENYDHDSIPENLELYMYPESVNLQIVESNGNLKVIRRDDLPPFNIYQPIPVIAAKWLELPCYPQSQIAVVEMYRPWAMKVPVDGNIMCCKINGAVHDCFSQRVSSSTADLGFGQFRFHPST